MDPFDDVLGTFDILDEHDERACGYVTNFYRLDGSETDDPREAFRFVGFIMEGAGAGKWISCETEPEDWERVKVH